MQFLFQQLQRHMNSQQSSTPLSLEFGSEMGLPMSLGCEPSVQVSEFVRDELGANAAIYLSPFSIRWWLATYTLYHPARCLNLLWSKIQEQSPSRRNWRRSCWKRTASCNRTIRSSRPMKVWSVRWKLFSITKRRCWCNTSWRFLAWVSIPHLQRKLTFNELFCILL